MPGSKGSGSDGLAVWFHAEAAGTTGLPYADGELVAYTTFDDTRVVALDVATGRKLWERRLALPPEFGFMPSGVTILAHEDLLLVSAWDLFALDRRTGIVRYVVRPAEDYPAVGRMDLHEGDIYSTGRLLHRIDATTGAVHWQRELDGEQPFSPVVADGVVYVGTRGRFGGGLGAGHAMALRVEDGSEIWRFPLPDADDANWHGGATAPGAVTDDLFIIASANGRVYGIDRVSGEERWMYRGGIHFYNGPVVIDDVAIVTNDGIQGIDIRTGEQLWRTDWMSVITSPTVVVGRIVLQNQPHLTAWNTSGQRLWVHEHRGRSNNGFNITGFSTAPAVHDGVVYVGSFNGMHAIRLPEELR